jgi:hypothetical protein
LVQLKSTVLMLPIPSNLYFYITNLQLSKNFNKNNFFVYTNKKPLHLYKQIIEDCYENWRWNKKQYITKLNKIVLNVLHTQNVINEKFNIVLKPYDLSGEQYNVLRILRGQKGIQQHEFDTRTYGCKKNK